MATLTVQTASSSSPNITSLLAASSSNGDAWLNTGHEILYIKSSNANTVTVTAQQPCSFNISSTAHDAAYSLPGDSNIYTLAIGGGGFPLFRFNDANQLAHVTYSAAGATVLIMSVAPKS